MLSSSGSIPSSITWQRGRIAPCIIAYCNDAGKIGLPRNATKHEKHTVEIIRKADPYDAIVVGSGAAGGWAVKELCEHGLDVLLLEAGPLIAPHVAQRSGAGVALNRIYSHFVSRHQHIQERHPIYWTKNPSLFVNDTEQPYETPADRPFSWIRGRAVGGRTLLWGGVTTRFSDFELQAASVDGYGENWPLEYRELAPYYDQVESFLGIYGADDRLLHLPTGRYVGEKRLTPGEVALKSGINRAWDDRTLVVSRGIDHSERLAGGGEWSKLTSCGTTLAAALRTGKLTLLPDALASHVTIDSATRKATGVAYVKRETSEWVEVRARVIVLCASAIESCRILLASDAECGGMIDGGADVLGRYLMDHLGSACAVRIPGVARNKERMPRSGADSFLIPRFRNLAHDKASFIRGYGYHGVVQRELPFFLERSGEATGAIAGVGEMLPQRSNRVQLSKRRTDRWGRLAPLVNCALGTNDIALRTDMRNQLEEMIDAAGGGSFRAFGALDFPGPWRFFADLEKNWQGSEPGLYVHEVGGARMGSEPAASVVNRYNQSWHVKNLFVADGACFVTSGWQHPALTIMALSARAASYIAAEAVRRNLD